METQFLCRECREIHLEPADGRLGHLVVCIDCALRLVAEVSEEPTVAHPDIAVAA